MCKFKIIFDPLVLSTSFLALVACSSPPSIDDSVQDASSNIDPTPAADSVESSPIQAVAIESEPATIGYTEEPRRVCEKRRRTGSNRRVSVCEMYVGSQPVRTVDERDSAIVWGTLSPGAPDKN